METVKLTVDEIRAIHEYLWANPCQSGCAYPEMEKSKKDCYDCKLEIAKNSILKKLGLD